MYLPLFKSNINNIFFKLFKLLECLKFASLHKLIIPMLFNLLLFMYRSEFLFSFKYFLIIQYTYNKINTLYYISEE